MVEILKHCMCGCIYEESECPNCNQVMDKDRIKGLEAELAKAQSRETMLWDLLEEVEAQIDLAEEVSREFADEVHIALWGK